ncbi:hypothetical protein RB653_004373 [Dictyostelium firmibasis]|uniref:Alternative oxidase n=1 Tax=Dictyostelium firmibasis TaxID=79012 RepID=A0AAN7Z013_9MYCE
MFKYTSVLNKNNNLNKLLNSFSKGSFNNNYNGIVAVSTINNSVRNFSQSKAMFDKRSEKPQNPLYHRNSTLYSFTPRDVLTKIEKDFVMPPSYEAKNLSDNFAKYSVIFLRKFSNLFFKEKFLHYAIVLETVAAVPGLVAGMFLHLKTLRNMQQNNWIKILMDEMENERMHLLSFMELTKPTITERALVAVTQAIYWNLFLVFYLASPKTAHRFTGYLEEQAVITYTHMLEDIDSGKVPNYKAPKIAIEYWGLPEDATLRDLILVIRQDESDHRLVNHEISNKIILNNNEPIVLENHFHKPIIVNPVGEEAIKEHTAEGIKIQNKINPTSEL